MSKMLFVVAISLVLVASASIFVYSQNQAEVVVRQGDTIQWVHLGPMGVPHKVRFGSSGATPVADINMILENFKPPLNAMGDAPPATSGTLLTAKVKDTAMAGATFVFTCGIHPMPMLSLPFRVEAKVAGQPARTHKITAEMGLHWHVHVDTTPMP